MAWPTKKLREVCAFQRGLTYAKKDETGFSENVVLRANNVDLKLNRLDLTELRYLKSDFEIPENKKVKAGSLIICTASGSKSHLGKVALIDQDYGYAFGGFMGQITPNSDVDSKYLFYVLTSDEYKAFIQELSSGVNINNLKFDDLGDFEFPLPPLPEQRRIVKILDEVFVKTAKAKYNTEQNLQNSRDLFNSYLHGVFAHPENDWQTKQLGEVCEVVNGGTPKTGSPEYWGGDIPWITPKDMGRLEVSVVSDTERKITKLGLHESSAKLIAPDSVILSTRAPIGHLAVNTVEMATNQGCKGLVPSDTLDVWFLFYFLKSSVELLNSLGSGTTFRELSGTKLKEIEIPFPPLPEQRRIVKILDELSGRSQQLQAVYRRKSDSTNELKKSVLHQAFTQSL